MLSIQHMFLTYLHNPEASNRIKAAAIYPDAVRAYTRNREYTHFEQSADGTSVSYIKFPKDMKMDQIGINKILQHDAHLVSDIKPCAIGELTNISAFYEHNSHLDSEMKRGIEYHLEQDMVFDDVVRNEFDCSLKYDDVFVRDGLTINGKQLRSDIADIEQHGIYVLAHRLYQEQGMTANQEWLEQNVQPLLVEQYGDDLAGKTYSFMRIREDMNQLITEHDWSKLDEGPMSLAKYDSMYDDVLDRMTDVDKTYETGIKIPVKNISMPDRSSITVESAKSVKRRAMQQLPKNSGQLSAQIQTVVDADVGKTYDLELD